MDQIIIRSHSGLRWILLLLLVATVFNAFRKWKANQDFVGSDDKLSLFTFIIAHLQLLLGLILFFSSEKVMLKGLDMANSILRFFTVEHTLGMLIAIILITVGRIQAKKITSGPQKHRKIFVMYLIALLLILISIPWPFRGLGAGWF